MPQTCRTWLDEEIYVAGANEAVRKTLQAVGISEEFTTMDRYDRGVLAGVK